MVIGIDFPYNNNTESFIQNNVTVMRQKSHSGNNHVFTARLLRFFLFFYVL